MNNLTAQDAHEIFLQALSELSEPLKSAVEFTLANWYKLNRERRPSVTKGFTKSVISGASKVSITTVYRSLFELIQIKAATLQLLCLKTVK